MRTWHWRATFLVMALGIFHGTKANAAVTYKTSTGALFTQVQGPGKFGIAWKTPDGTIWSWNQGKYANYSLQPDVGGIVTESRATIACAKIGGTLPSSDDYRKLVSYFERDSDHYLTDRGRSDLKAIFDDMNFEYFWSTSVSELHSHYAYGFESGYGGVNVVNIYGDRESARSVRCVSK